MATHRLTISWDNELELMAIERECQACEECATMQELLSTYLEGLSEELRKDGSSDK